MQNPRSRRGTTAPELCSLCPVTTKQQRRWFLGFLFSRVPWDALAAASRPQHLCSNPPAGCPSCPLAGHTQSLGGTVPLPVHARLQPPPLLGGARRNPRLGQGAKALLAKVHPRWHRQIPGDPRSPQGCDPNSQTQALAASLTGSLPTMVIFSLPWQKEINCILTIHPSIKLIGQAIGTGL